MGKQPPSNTASCWEAGRWAGVRMRGSLSSNFPRGRQHQSSGDQQGFVWGAEETPMPLTALSIPTFRTRSELFSKPWTNSITSNLSPLQMSVAGAAVSGWSRLAWPGTRKVSGDLDSFLKSSQKPLCLGERQPSNASGREWLFIK